MRFHVRLKKGCDTYGVKEEGKRKVSLVSHMFSDHQWWHHSILLWLYPPSLLHQQRTCLKTNHEMFSCKINTCDHQSIKPQTSVVIAIGDIIIIFSLVFLYYTIRAGEVEYFVVIVYFIRLTSIGKLFWFESKPKNSL